MSNSPESRAAATVQALRSMLRADLAAAMKARQTEVIAALRSALAAIDNAEAVQVADTPAEPVSEHVAGTRPGVGSTEAERRVLSIDEVRALLQSQIEERIAEADRYDTFGQHAAARRLRREAEALKAYVDP